MTMLAGATPRATNSSINLRCATPVPAIAIDRPNSPPLRPLPTAVVNAPRQRTPSDEIPIASDATPRPTPRGFLPWRFAYDGPAVCAAPPSWGRHPQTFTKPDLPLRSVLTTHLGHQVADCGRKSRANRQPSKRINRGASFIHNSIASSGVSPRPSAAKSQVQQIRASPAMTRCRFASVPLDCV